MPPTAFALAFLWRNSAFFCLETNKIALKHFLFLLLLKFGVTPSPLHTLVAAGSAFGVFFIWVFLSFAHICSCQCQERL
jgi:hypothetical protein